MKLANGSGSIYRMKDNRRTPWRVAVTVRIEYDEKTGKARQKRKIVGNYATQKEAMKALTDYQENPYALDADKITFADIYERWSQEHYENIVPSAARTFRCAYAYFSPIQDMRFSAVRVSHLEGCIKEAKVGASTKQRMKSLVNLMYKYAMKHEIVTTNYASLCDSIKRPKPVIERIPFSEEDEKTLWENTSFPFVDMILIGIYSGWRPQELAVLKISDVDLENGFYKGGLKTDAGRNRTVPIHSCVAELVRKNYEKAVSMGSEYLFNDEDGQQGTYMTYDKYRRRWEKVMKHFRIKHRPHDTRHTFITKAKSAGMDEYLLKLMVGHEISDVTEKVYTHRTNDELKEAMELIKPVATW